MHKIIRRAFNIAATDEAHEVTAARAMGVTLKNAASEVRATYGQDQTYSQVFWTACGNNLVISADNRRVNAALCTGDFSWEDDVYSEDRAYANIDEAAGLRGEGAQEMLREALDYGEVIFC